MTDFFDDDPDFWDPKRSEPTIQLSRVNKRAPERTRTHHVVQKDPSGATRPRATDDPETAEHQQMWVEPVAGRRHRSRAGRRGGLFGAVDPRLLSIGAVAIATVLAVPLFSAFGSDSKADEAESVVTAAETTTTLAAPTTTVAVTTTAVADESSDESDGSRDHADDAQEVDGESGGNAIASAGDGSGSTDPGAGGSGGGGVLAAPAVRSPAQCANPYEVQAGDYWLGIATAVDTGLDDLLAYNEATADTPIYPGSTVCLPIGTSVAPTPTTAATTTEPATTAPGTTPAPTTTEAATTEPAPTSQAPTTTEAAPPEVQPTTTASPDEDDDDGGIPLPQNDVPSGGEVEQMIRDIWPDDLEDQAVRIAWRESNFRPDVTSSIGCCLGVFQLNWEAHRSWMVDLGITSREQLFDARTNVTAAYALYQRAGGWGAWQ